MGRLAPLATARLPFELAQDRLDAAASIRPRATRRATQKRDRFAPPCAKRVAGPPLEPHARSREVRDEERQRLTMAPVSGTSMASDKCGSYTLTSTGVRGVTGATLSRDECWK